MIVAILAAVVPVLIGSLLATSPGLLSPSRLGPARTFALFAALSVVLVELLPEAAASTGALALGLFAVGLVLPALAEKVVGGRGGEHSTAGEEIAFAALALHQLVDGVEVGVAWSVSDSAWAVTLAIAAHSVPLLAAVLLEFARHGTRVGALLRGALLAVCTGAGAALGHGGTEILPGAETWLPALLAGLLIHVLWHQHDENVPATMGTRWADLLGAVAGFAVPLVFMDFGHHHGEVAEHRAGAAEVFGHSLLELSYETAPMLLLGLGLGAVVQSMGNRIPARWLRGGSALSDATRGAVVGAPLPLCACSVLPISEALVARRAGAALVVAFLLATPELGVETFVLSVQFLGWEFAVLRLVGAVLAAGVAAVVLARAVGPQEAGEPQDVEVSGESSLLTRLWESFEELVLHIGPFVVAGLVFAALVDAFVTTEQVVALARSGWDLPVVSAVAVPMYVCASSATPLAGVLWAKGLTPGAVLAGLLLGPATNVATFGFLWKTYGRKAVVAGLLAFLAVTWGLALAANQVLPAVPPEGVGVAGEHAHGPWTIGFSVLLAVILVRSAWKAGPRAWLAEMTARGGHDHDHHGHGHGHGHDHGHG
ncbi:MAG: permease, partial [Deltaproteobacteria bacterium]|nr:permease [Deltaproteobacteria bacterium]